MLLRWLVSTSASSASIPNGAPHIRDSNNFQPLYHEKNVIAYPQTQEYVKQVVGVTPLDLAKTLLVQFLGSDRAVVRRDPALQVSVRRLRAAMKWLSVNSWHWMTATKSLGLGVAADGSIELGSQVEGFFYTNTRRVSDPRTQAFPQPWSNVPCHYNRIRSWP